MCAPAFPSALARKASSSTSGSNATPIRRATRWRSTCRSSPTASPCAATRSSRSRRAKRKTLPAVSDGFAPKAFRARSSLAGDPALVKLVAGLNALVEYPYGCTEQRLVAGARRAGAEGLLADPRGGGARGSHLRQCEDDRAGDRTIHRRRWARRLLAARARQCLAHRLVLRLPRRGREAPASRSTRRCSTGSPMC